MKHELKIINKCEYVKNNFKNFQPKATHVFRWSKWTVCPKVALFLDGPNLAN